MPKRLSLLACSAVALAAVAHLAGCRRAGATYEENQAAPGRLAPLALLPDETHIVLSLDLDRLRGQPIWRTLSSVLAKHAQPFLDGIAAGSGVDPVRRVHRIWIALPGERQDDGRFALLAEMDPADASRAMAWLQKRADKEMAVFLHDQRQLVIGKGAWSKVTAELQATRRGAHSAADVPELRRLCQRAEGEHGAWFAALVPIGVRRTLMKSGRMPDAASLARVFGLLDDAGGLHVELVGEFANTADPPLLAHRLRVLHNQAKRDPDLLVAGLSPYLESVHVEAHNARVRVALDLPDTQADGVILRIEALALMPRTKYSRAP